MYENRKKEKIKACIAVAILILAIAITGIISMKYTVEGEKNPPFKLSKITVVSTAEGVENEGTSEKWNFSVYQNNDIYFSIEKNEENDKNEIIENISIENIKITKAPETGEIKAFMPNSVEGRTFSYSPDYILEEDNLTYKGASKSNSRTLEIGNQGGTAIIRFSNIGLGKYISEDDQEIKHDGTMLSKIGVNGESIKFEVNFDLKKKSYTTNITLQLPCGENLVEEGTSSQEMKDEFIFRRVKK